MRGKGGGVSSPRKDGVCFSLQAADTVFTCAAQKPFFFTSLFYHPHLDKQRVPFSMMRFYNAHPRMHDLKFPLQTSSRNAQHFSNLTITKNFHSILKVNNLIKSVKMKDLTWLKFHSFIICHFRLMFIFFMAKVQFMLFRSLQLSYFFDSTTFLLAQKLLSPDQVVKNHSHSKQKSHIREL